MIGDDLLTEAFGSKLAADAQRYGDALLDRARRFAAVRQIELENAGRAVDPESVEFKLDVIVCAEKWCRFWAGHGHWLEAYF